MPEQCFRRIKAALVANLDDKLRIWESPTTPSDMPGISLADMQVPAERIFIYPLSVESSFPVSWPLIYFDSPSTERSRIESNANRTRIDEHTFDLVIGVQGAGVGGTDGLETVWCTGYRLASAVRDVLESNAVSGAAVDNSGSPYDIEVGNLTWGDTVEQDQGGLAIFMRLQVTARERRTTTYTGWPA